MQIRKFTELQRIGQNTNFEVYRRTNLKHVHKPYDFEVNLWHKLYGQNYKPYRMGDDNNFDVFWKNDWYTDGSKLKIGRKMQYTERAIHFADTHPFSNYVICK